MIIAHNISAINTYNRMGISSKSTDKSMEKLSSGYRINRAADDAAGLSISEKMRSQIRGLNQASENAQHGISMIQTAEGALNESHSILQRMRELAVQAATDTNAASDREALQGEIDQLTSEINRIGNTTEYNGMKILNGSKIKTTGKEDIQVSNEITAGNLNLAPGMTGAQNDAELDFVNGITIDNTATIGPNGTNLGELSTTEGTNTIEFSKNNGKLVMNIHLEDADGLVYEFSTSEIPQNADGDYEYPGTGNDSGISFVITKESVQDFLTNGSDSDKTSIDLTKAGTLAADGLSVKSPATVNFDNPYEMDSSSKGEIVNFALDAWNNNSRVDYDKVEIEFTNASTTSKASLKVTYFNAGNEISTVIREMEGIGAIAVGDAANEDITFDNYGISFGLKLLEGFGTTDKIHAIIDLDKEAGISTVQGNGLATDNSVYFHVGANTDQVINTTFSDMRANALGLTGTGEAFTDEYTVNNGTDSEPTERGLNISTRASANAAIDIIDNAISIVSAERSKYGAIQNRLEYTINNLDTTSENMTSAESTIRDTDMAEEMMDMTKSNILQQASQAMLSQAMQRPQQVLQLLQ